LIDPLLWHAWSRFKVNKLSCVKTETVLIRRQIAEGLQQLQNFRKILIAKLKTVPR